MAEPEVVVVGAGPAGAATAFLLARSGVPVTLVEREHDFERVFRGEGLMPSGIDALLQMGLEDLLVSIPTRRLEAWDVYAGGVEIFSVPEPVEELGDRAVRVVSQPALLEGLIERAATGRFRFERGATVRDLLREDDRVVGVRIAREGGERELRAALVVGCDGRVSMLRKRAGLALDLLPERYDVAWFRMPAPERLRDRSAMTLVAGASAAAACYVSWDGRLQLALTIPKGGWRDRRDADWVEEIARPAPDWLAAHVRSVRDRIEGPVLLDVIVGRCPSWTVPGLLLLGDAAHPMSPIRAQGINLALRDAIVAANHLVPVLRGDAAPAALDAAARAVQIEREPEIVRSQTLQLRDARGLNSRAAPFLIAVAKHVGRWLGRYRWARQAWLAQQRDLRFGSTVVRLELPGLEPRIAAPIRPGGAGDTAGTTADRPRPRA